MTDRFLRFGLISGSGWVLDFAVMLWLTGSGVSVFVANSVGAFLGVTFVFIVSTRHVFKSVSHWPWYGLIGVYWAWQAFAILAASMLISGLSFILSSQGLFSSDETMARAALAAKIVVTPLTLVANFMFMRRLLERPRKRVS